MHFVAYFWMKVASAYCALVMICWNFNAITFQDVLKKSFCIRWMKKLIARGTFILLNPNNSRLTLNPIFQYNKTVLWYIWKKNINIKHWSKTILIYALLKNKNELILFEEKNVSYRKKTEGNLFPLSRRRMKPSLARENFR